MRVLHLYSDFRWTGPAEPTVSLVRELKVSGVEVVYACGTPPKPYPSSILAKAPQFGVEPVTRFRLSRYNNPIDTVRDVATLPRYIAEGGFDIVHTHLTHDHVLGAIAAKLCRRRVKVVRTNHKGVAIKLTLGRRALLSHCVDGYVGFSEEAAARDRRTLGIGDDRVCVVSPAVDRERFYPAEPPGRIRAEMGLADDDVVAGIVARVQRHRRFEVLLRAVDLAKERAPRLRLIIVGRGRALEEVAKDPVRRMGLEGVVKFAGYRREDYVDVVRAMDFKVFMVPGSDGTCRAAREAMACGKPVVAARRGMLPELVPDGRAGLVIDDSPERLADALVTMANDDALRRRLGEGALAWANERFGLAGQAQRVLGLYERLLG